MFWVKPEYCIDLERECSKCENFDKDLGCCLSSFFKDLEEKQKIYKESKEKLKK